jgi:hypothetical protein
MVILRNCRHGSSSESCPFVKEIISVKEFHIIKNICIWIRAALEHLHYLRDFLISMRQSVFVIYFFPSPFSNLSLPPSRSPKPLFLFFRQGHNISFSLFLPRVFYFMGLWHLCTWLKWFYCYSLLHQFIFVVLTENLEK